MAHSTPPLRIASFFILAVCILTSSAQSSDDYEWRNVPIGSGGYISGMRFHPLPPHHAYLRTDVGGAYRRNEDSGRLDQLFNLGVELKDYYAVAGIAFVPSDPNSVILAVGRKCTAASSAILVSNDRGENWEIIDVPFYFAANGGRDCSGDSNDKDREGNCIEINPLDHTQLYVGTREEGLWILDLDDPQNPTQIAAADIPHDSNRLSIRNVLFHPVQEELVFIGYAGYGVYMGNTLNGTWEKIDTNLPDLTLTNDLSFSASGNTLYSACKGEGVYRCTDPTTANRNWEQVLNYTGNDVGHLTVTASPHNEGLVMSVQNNWASLDDVKVSQDGGDTWTTKNASLNNIFPWKNSGFGSNPSQLTFHPAPVNANHLYLTAFFGSYQTTNHTTPTIAWSNEFNRGHEEVVATEITAFPEDWGKSVMALSSTDADRLVIANESGIFWEDISDGTGFSESIGTSVVNNTCGAIEFECQGSSEILRDTLINMSVFSNYRPLEADRTMGCVFYYYDQFTGTFHVSTDKGESWCRVNNTLPVVPSIWTHKIDLTSVPGYPGLLFLNFKDQLLKSTDGGQNWTQEPGVDRALLFGFGKERPGENMPALYLFGRVNGDYPSRAYHSWDGGENWTAINVPSEFNIGNPQMMVGDRNTYGQVYIGSGGQGVFVGEYNGSLGCAADINEDGDIDVEDFLVLNSFFGSQCIGCPADIDGDGVVGVNDFVSFNSVFGSPCD